MLSDEDIKAMKERQAARSPLGNSHWNAAYIDIAKLLSEVETLNHTMSGWQSVADGAKPGPEDWYVAACTDRERDFNSNAVTSRTRATSRYPGQSLLDGATHFLVIPPPPIKRKS